MFKKFVDVLKYEGDNSTFIYKHPSEDFSNMTQLIVHESQEAIFFMNGQALDMFGPGRFTLTTQNCPMLTGALKGVTKGGKNPFHCEVYFINKTTQMAIKWGTDSRVRFLDPNLGIPLEIGASGELNLRVKDSRKLLVKVVGTMKGIAWDDRSKDGFTKSLQSSFRPLISTAVKTHLAKTIKDEKINILEIDEQLGVLSEGLRKVIEPGFLEYGLEIPQLYVSTVLLPEDDPKFQQVKELHSLSFDVRMKEAERQKILEEETTKTEVAKRVAQRKIIEEQTKAEGLRLHGFAEADVMHAQGYDKKDEFGRDVQIAYAQGLGQVGSKAGGGGGMANEIVGLGMGLAAVGTVGKQVGAGLNNLTQNGGLAGGTAAPTGTVTCAGCGANIPAGTKFCPQCGAPVVTQGATQITCPNCHRLIPAGKFCPECGTPLAAACPTCGQTNPPGTKFCSNCGTKLI